MIWRDAKSTAANLLFVRDVLTSGDITNEPSMKEWTGAEVRLMKDGKKKER